MCVSFFSGWLRVLVLSFEDSGSLSSGFSLVIIGSLFVKSMIVF